MGRASVWALGGPGPWFRSLSTTITGLMDFSGNAMLSSRLVSLRYRLRLATSLVA